jgi:hypothetical protein
MCKLKGMEKQQLNPAERVKLECLLFAVEELNERKGRNG